ncbi:MAG: DUF2388 domain-containing protein [Pseudomonas sp.]|jgi:uncharacterized protein (TIGR02448 family)|uniref:DUF2388 domain-containing protein n=1 Tax=unclassified Pseudomonas TaxID=196821 RepID=UPI00200548F6|nr:MULTISPECIES: DUF2388 domain-containing protein [unclassified Pseudomonas]MCK6186129.1 DUF2388 domain-containing protein [Pseudomonas sp. EYE_354]WLH69193.1 DUF2388 domain-containing protein [Pseudomonas sp. FP2309]
MPRPHLIATLALCALPLLVHANEGKSPIEGATLASIALPFLTVFATLGTTSHPVEMLKSAKSDALAFVGSDGDIRTAHFELAVRTYHTAYPAPHMSDMQLAQAIAVTH